jgi:hypothetical protein
MRIIAIDFDGCIVKDKYPEIGELIPEAKTVINKLHENGDYIILWTCRDRDHLINAINFLLENEIWFDRVNDHNPENLKKYGHAVNKVYANIYIDDKSLGTPLLEDSEKDSKSYTDWTVLDKLLFE